ncbi:bifunctional lytic transglycosylase/C40 family peptidase [Kibdelosporangium philippinense]|uniref:Bifunctional lytic transglycosylase/C40 family peptidase n=1 Tax=Kibdelosporangium philippinense TaxID=211113 RepID=A0ABS8ZQC7_9PSEU|nr:bifunctional lytic transglycosylase/C40 family peptidase [Kibdelosporangium philippinense]MCE7009920.1 bifunctional lytic transglycosylase/C40 family peptidase [Kibdelosporangium philippinense]
MASKAVIGVIALLVLVPVLIAAAGKGAVEAVLGSTSNGTIVNCGTPIADIPSDYCALYVQASAVCPGLDWSILAAIGKIETDHGRSNLPGVHSGENFAGAGGPMQFLHATFNGVVSRHTIPPGGANPPSRYNPHDAIHAAAFYLCDSGAPGDLYKAIFAYNHADWYVKKVLEQAETYSNAAAAAGGAGDCNAIQAPNAPAAAAINYACGQRGLPYVWGGDGPSEGGFDCSGLTKAAYSAAGINLPRTAHTQYHAGPRVPAGQPLLPGDLVFYGPPSKVRHVGLYIGAGKMIHAPTFGERVQIGSYRWNRDGYLGATRPATSAEL